MKTHFNWLGLKQKKSAYAVNIQHSKLNQTLEPKGVPMNKNNLVVIPGNPWASSRSELLKELHVYKDKGLDQVMVARRSKQFDSNPHRGPRVMNAWKTLTVRFALFIGLLLLVMIFVLLVLGQWVAGVIAFVLTIIFVTLESLTKKKEFTARVRISSNLKTRVRRDGEAKEIPTDKLLPGDIVLLEPGDLLTVDLRLIEVSNLQMDESTITGDLIPVDKQVEPLEAEVPLTRRTNMAFKGTSVVSGSGEGMVVALGADTTLNKIATLVDNAKLSAAIDLSENRNGA